MRNDTEWSSCILSVHLYFINEHISCFSFACMSFRQGRATLDNNFHIPCFYRIESYLIVFHTLLINVCFCRNIFSGYFAELFVIVRYRDYQPVLPIIQALISTMAFVATCLISDSCPRSMMASTLPPTKPNQAPVA